MVFVEPSSRIYKKTEGSVWDLFDEFCREKPWLFLGINTFRVPPVWPCLTKWFNAHCDRNIKVLYVGKGARKSRKKHKNQRWTKIETGNGMRHNWHSAAISTETSWCRNSCWPMANQWKILENLQRSDSSLVNPVPITQKITNHLHFERKYITRSWKYITSFRSSRKSFPNHLDGMWWLNGSLHHKKHPENIQPSSHHMPWLASAGIGSACCRFSWVKCSKSRKLRGTWVHLAWIACRTKSLPEIAGKTAEQLGDVEDRTAVEVSGKKK